MRINRAVLSAARTTLLVIAIHSSNASAQTLSLRRIPTTTSQALEDIGTVADVAIDGVGRLYFLDSEGPQVVVTDNRLRHLASFGRRGSGPGEFREPVSIAFLPQGRLAVLDRALRRVTVLGIGPDERPLRYEHSFPTRIRSEAMCAVSRSELLIYGYRDENRLHVFDLIGRRVRSFAPSEFRFSPMARDMTAYGTIACDLERDEVVVSSYLLPVVEAFRISSGRRVWIDTLRPFRLLRIEDGGDRVRLSAGDAGNNRIVRVLSRGNHRIFQTVFDARSDDGADTVMSYTYSLRRRTWLPVDYQVPLLHPVHAMTVVAVREEGSPRISLHELTIITASRPARGGRRRPP